MHKVVFFDIDGTLVESGGAGRAAFISALHSVFNWTDNIDYIHFSGATDLDVLRQIFERYECELTEDDTLRFFDQLPVELEEAVLTHKVYALPGVAALLDQLAHDPDCIAGLITGNIESCARIKLAAAGIDHPFLLGAFGHEHADRNEIAKLAFQRACDLLPAGAEIGAAYLIGDSPADIAAAHAIGAHAIAVATGTPSYRELTDAGANTVLENLLDADLVGTIIQLGHRER